MLTLQIQLQQAELRAKDLERTVFESVPKSWDEFQQRYGRWLEVQDNIQQIEALIDQEKFT
jgi:uncharacterized protein YeaO (DUF488 family)